jgi:hypothetical protein
MTDKNKYAQINSFLILLFAVIMMSRKIPGQKKVSNEECYIRVFYFTEKILNQFHFRLLDYKIKTTIK